MKKNIILFMLFFCLASHNLTFCIDKDDFTLDDPEIQIPEYVIEGPWGQAPSDNGDSEEKVDTVNPTENKEGLRVDEPESYNYEYDFDDNHDQKSKISQIILMVGKKLAKIKDIRVFLKTSLVITGAAAWAYVALITLKRILQDSQEKE